MNLNIDIKYWWGEDNCQASLKSKTGKCKNKAYYIEDSQLLCGVHSKKKILLDKNPERKQILKDKYAAHMLAVKKVAKTNKMVELTKRILMKQ